jgi:P27 family predicted phage terminase small subunit
VARPRKRTPAGERARGYPNKRKGRTDREIKAVEAAETATPPIAAVPAPPGALGKRARVLWDTLLPDLVRRRVVKDTDLIAFRRYVLELARWEAFEKQSLDKNGKPWASRTAKSKDGNTYTEHNMALKEMRASEKELKAFEARFGLDPASRLQLLTRQAAVGDAPPRITAVNPADPNKPPRPLGFLNSGRLPTPEDLRDDEPPPELLN